MKKENGMYYLMNKNEKIAKTAFEGGLHGRHLSTTSRSMARMVHLPSVGSDFPMQWNRTNLPTVVLITGSMDRGSVTTG